MRQDSIAHIRRVLANPACKDQSIDPADRYAHGCYMLRGLQGIIGQRKGGFGVIAFRQGFGIVGQSGKTFQAGLFIENPFHIINAQPHVPDHVENRARIQRAAPRSHRESVQSGHTHRGVDTLSVPDRAQAGTVAQMRRHDAFLQKMRVIFF